MRPRFADIIYNTRVFWQNIVEFKVVQIVCHERRTFNGHGVMRMSEILTSKDWKLTGSWLADPKHLYFNCHFVKQL